MLFNEFNNIFGDVSKWGRFRVPPVADATRNKEWQRSKFCDVNNEKKFSGTATGYNGHDSKSCIDFVS